MAVTTAEVAAAIRLTADPTVSPAEPLLSIIHRQLQTAQGEVEGYAPDAPEYVKDEAIIRAVGWLFEAPPTMQGHFFIHSGARALLARYHEQGQVHSDTPPTPTTTPEAPLVPSAPFNPHPGLHFRFMGWSDNVTIEQSELDAATQFSTDVMVVPARATPGHIFAAFPADIGVPDSAILDGNPTNQRSNWSEQVTPVLSRGGEQVAILSHIALLNPAIAGRTWTFGYSSP